MNFEGQIIGLDHNEQVSLIEFKPKFKKINLIKGQLYNQILDSKNDEIATKIKS